MLAQLELHLAQEHKTRAREYAEEIISRAPANPYVGCMYLAKAMDGTHYDPRFNLRNELIAYYKAHIEKYPNCVDTYQWLIGQLIADHRLAEAQHYCQKLSKFETGFSLTVERIKIALAYRNLEGAQAMWMQMGEDYPDNFTVWQWIGDFQTQVGDYETAKESYRRSIDLLGKPRYCDPVRALALCCEMDGDLAGAIAARELELVISEEDWHDTTGESVEVIRREIDRLQALHSAKHNFGLREGGAHMAIP